MHAMTRNVPPHTPQCSMSMWKTRLSRCIQLMGGGEWDEGGEAGDELDGVEHDVSGAVTEGVLETTHDLPAVIDREAFVGDGGAGDVATEPLSCLRVAAIRRRVGATLRNRSRPAQARRTTHRRQRSHDRLHRHRQFARARHPQRRRVLAGVRAGSRAVAGRGPARAPVALGGGGGDHHRAAALPHLRARGERPAVHAVRRAEHAEPSDLPGLSRTGPDRAADT